MVRRYPGPVITRYEIEPAVGVKGAQIVNLARDLARALSVIAIRVVETIPGTSCMGLEIPNPKREIVRLSEIVGSQAYADLHSKITIALGKDITGKPMVADLAQDAAPARRRHHRLGQVGRHQRDDPVAALQGTPREVRLILIDPKMLELSIYEGIPHLLAPVVTDMRQAGAALNWCVAEMERRYKLMCALGAQPRRLQPEGARGDREEASRSSIPSRSRPTIPRPSSRCRCWWW